MKFLIFSFLLFVIPCFSNQKEELSMCANLSLCTFSFGVKAKKVQFSIEIEEEVYEMLSETTKSAFQKMSGKYVFFHKASEDEKISYPCKKLASPRIIETGKPKAITLEKLEECLKKETVLFYTGAGMSAAAGIPMMNGLKIMFPENAHQIENAIADPKIIVERIRFFHFACFNFRPTRAHQSLKGICSKMDIPLYTENLDQLHQKSGIDPFCLNGKNDLTSFDETKLKATNMIICVGLSFDDKGLLSYYKKINPKGSILSIDLVQPKYLGSEDFFLEGDLQEVLPKLEQMLRKKCF